MKIKDVPTGTKIKCCGATAKVLSHGTMGTRVSVETIPENCGFVIGFQIWSSNTLVERS